MPVEVLLGWVLICVVMYILAALIVAVAVAVLRTIRRDVRPSKAILRGINLGTAVALWYGIPLVVHALYGAAAH